MKKLFRKSILLPAEHGSWVWLLVPLAVGAWVGGSVRAELWLLLAAALAIFLFRQPFIVWMRLRKGKGRPADRPLAAGWSALLASTGLICLAALLGRGLGRLLWLGLPLIPVLVVYVVAASNRQSKVRTAWIELAGALGLAVTAPAAYVASTGRLDRTAWILWAVVAAQSALGMFYVRLRIADTHRRPARRWVPMAVHGVVTLGAIAGVLADGLPWPAAVPFVALFARSIWVSLIPRPIASVKRFGMMEAGVAVVAGLMVVLGYRLA